jgi:nitrate/nitrite-specific signal transduction histidine kinase
VELQNRAAGRVAVRVQDDGIGVSEGAEMKGGELGLQLIRTLAQQIHADLSVEHATGTTVELEFLGRG